MRILNLGCGTKLASSPEVVNLDWSLQLRVARVPGVRMALPILAGPKRDMSVFASTPNLLVANLAKGIPFPDSSVDVVYHSHFLEHIDRGHVLRLLGEALRVLRPGGVQRIVVPDFERIARAYVDHLDNCECDPTDLEAHEVHIAEAIEQSVRRRAYGSSQQSWWRRAAETLILGDARRRGETHQWMYDGLGLSLLLRRAGFSSVVRQTYDSSLIPGWARFGLDTGEDGHEYKPGSLYMEAEKGGIGDRDPGPDGGAVELRS